MARMRLYLHIGYHRTGTTFLQHLLWENRSALEQQGVLVPAVALSGPTHAHLANALAEERKAKLRPLVRDESGPDPYELPPGEDASSLYAALHEAARRARLPTVVVTSECFLEWVDPRRVRSLIDHDLFDVRIIAYVRRQDHWLASAYSQIVRDRYFRFSGSPLDLPQVELMDYAGWIGKWADAFGDDAIVLRVYREGRDPADLARDFLAILGAASSALQLPPRRLNAGLHPAAVEILRRWNRLALPARAHAELLKAAEAISRALKAAAVPPSPDPLGRRRRRRILRRHEAGNRELAARFAPSATGQLFSSEVPPEPTLRSPVRAVLAGLGVTRRRLLATRLGPK